MVIGGKKRIAEVIAVNPIRGLTFILDNGAAHLHSITVGLRSCARVGFAGCDDLWEFALADALIVVVHGFALLVGISIFCIPAFIITV